METKENIFIPYKEYMIKNVMITNLEIIQMVKSK